MENQAYITNNNIIDHKEDSSVKLLCENFISQSATGNNLSKPVDKKNNTNNLSQFNLHSKENIEPRTNITHGAITSNVADNGEEVLESLACHKGVRQTITQLEKKIWNNPSSAIKLNQQNSYNISNCDNTIRKAGKNNDVLTIAMENHVVEFTSRTIKNGHIENNDSISVTIDVQQQQNAVNNCTSALYLQEKSSLGKVKQAIMAINKGNFQTSHSPGLVSF